MKTAILDTSFILTCLKQKIDFEEELEMLGIQAKVPVQVLQELEGLKSSNREAKLALECLGFAGIEKIDIPGKITDKAIINYANKNPQVIVATLDREIKKKTTNPKLIIRGKKRLEII